MNSCPHCGSSVAVTDRAGNPFYSCGSTKSFKSQHCVDREPLFRQLTESQEYARKLNLKIGDLCKEHDALAAQLERANEEIEVHKDRIQDLRELVQEYRQCIRPGDLANLREEEA